MQASTVSLIGLACLVAVTLLLTLRKLHDRGLRGDLQDGSHHARPIHVCLCSDDTDLRPAAVAIKSAFVNAKEPHRLKFHFVTTPELAGIFLELLHSHLPEVHLEVHTNEKVLRKISSAITWRSSSKVGRDMASAFNFAPFFLPEILGITRTLKFAGVQRLIYLDTDTVMLDDIGALDVFALHGKPVAAARSLLHTLKESVDLELVKTIDKGVQLQNSDFVAHRGVMVVDVAKWRAKDVSGKILSWLQHYSHQDLMQDLWAGSMSLPPWMLSLDLHGFVDLGIAWACQDIGEEELSSEASFQFRRHKFTREDFIKTGMSWGRAGSMQPGIHECSARAKLLHFGGPLKPWLASTLMYVQPLCVVPQVSPPSPRGWARDGEEETIIHIKKKNGDTRFTNCSNLWWAFLTADADCALKDYFKPWRDGLSAGRTIATTTVNTMQDPFFDDPGVAARAAAGIKTSS